ncbi:hypothetical protein B484DRAFT_406108, partial [Ochromonadaceae sp. CCMP2298]
MSQYISHLIRLKQECGVMQHEINELQPGTTLAIFDFKKKWMSMYYREAQVDFFAKAGKAWGGLAVVRKVPLPPGQLTFEGLSYRIETRMFDIISNDGCEDFVSVSATIETGLRIIKQEYPEVERTKLFLDGAGALAGAATLRELSLYGVRFGLVIVSVFVCVSGDGKTALDGHFAYAMMIIWLYVVAGKGKQDITDAQSVVNSQQTNGGIKGSQALQIRFAREHMPDKKKMPKVKDIGSICRRELQYDAQLGLTGVKLRRHSHLGPGRFMSRELLFGTFRDTWPADGTRIETLTRGSAPDTSNSSVIRDDETKRRSAKAKTDRHLQHNTNIKQKARNNDEQIEAFQAASPLFYCKHRDTD